MNQHLNQASNTRRIAWNALQIERISGRFLNFLEQILRTLPVQIGGGDRISTSSVAQWGRPTTVVEPRSPGRKRSRRGAKYR